MKNFLQKVLPVMRYGIEKFKNCFSIFSGTVKDRVMKFSGMTDLSIMERSYWLTSSAVISVRHRKWIKKSKFSKLTFQIEIYTTLLSLFSIAENNWPHRKLKCQLPVNSKRIFKFSIFNASNLLYYDSVSFEINICCWH